MRSSEFSEMNKGGKGVEATSLLKNLSEVDLRYIDRGSRGGAGGGGGGEGLE